MGYFIRSLVAVLAILGSNPVHCIASNGSYEAILYTKLLNDLTLVRPVKEFNDTVQVQVKFRPSYLQRLDTTQIFSISGMLLFKWYDDSLKWDPADYGSTMFTYLPASRIWKPNFGIMNSAESSVFGDSMKNKFLVDLYPNGLLKWKISDTFTATCRMDPEQFPFDIQRCSINVGSWGPISYENYTGIGLVTKYLVINDEWTLLNSYVTNFQIVHDGVSYSEIEFSFTFKRKAGFYIATMIMPLIILSLLGLLVFVLPPESGDKISLGMTCLLSFYVMQAAITENLPSTYSTMPYIVEVILIMMVSNALTVATTIITTSLLLKQPYANMPQWLDRLVRIPNKVGTEVQGYGQASLKDMTDKIINKAEKLDQPNENAAHVSAVCEDIFELGKSSRNQDEDLLAEKWKKVADIVNKALLTIFIFAYIIIIIVILPPWIGQTVI